MTTYEQIWSDFLAAGQLSDHWRVWTDWAGLESTHLVFLARVGADARVAQRVWQVQAALKPVGGLDLHPRRFLHLTVQALGFLPRDGVLTQDEISPDDLPIAVEAVRQALDRQTPFTVRLAGANSFYSSAFLEIHDDGALGTLRRRLQAVLPRLGATDSWPDYVFHLTVAYYRSTYFHGVRQALEPLRDLPPIEFQVRELELLALHTKGDLPYPPMLRLARFPFREGHP